MLGFFTVFEKKLLLPELKWSDNPFVFTTLLLIQWFSFLIFISFFTFLLALKVDFFLSDDSLESSFGWSVVFLPIWILYFIIWPVSLFGTVYFIRLSCCSENRFAPNIFLYSFLFFTFSFFTLLFIPLILDDAISPDPASLIFIPIMTFFGILFCCQCPTFVTNKIQGTLFSFLGLYALITMIMFSIQIDHSVSWSWNIIFLFPFYVPDLFIFAFILLLAWFRIRLSNENRISNIFYYSYCFTIWLLQVTFHILLGVYLDDSVHFTTPLAETDDHLSQRRLTLIVVFTPFWASIVMITVLTILTIITTPILKQKYAKTQAIQKLSDKKSSLYHTLQKAFEHRVTLMSNRSRAKYMECMKTLMGELKDEDEETEEDKKSGKDVRLIVMDRVRTGGRAARGLKVHGWILEARRGVADLLDGNAVQKRRERSEDTKKDKSKGKERLTEEDDEEKSDRVEILLKEGVDWALMRRVVEYMYLADKKKLPAVEEWRKKYEPSKVHDPIPDLRQDMRNLCTKVTTQGREDLSSGQIVFEVEGEEVCAHKEILSARYDYFHAMFGTQMREAAAGHVRVEEVSKKLFVAMLKSIYSGEVTDVFAPNGETTSWEKVEGFITLCNRYGTLDLLEECQSVLGTMVEPSNVLDVYSISEYHYLQLLKEYCTFFVLIDYDRISQLHQFERMPKETKKEWRNKIERKNLKVVWNSFAERAEAGALENAIREWQDQSEGGK